VLHFFYKYVLFILPCILISKSLFDCFSYDTWSLMYFIQYSLSHIPFIGKFLLEFFYLDNGLSIELLKHNQELSKYFFIGSIGAFLGKMLSEAFPDLYCTMDNTNITGGGSTPPAPMPTSTTPPAPMPTSTTPPAPMPTSAPAEGLGSSGRTRADYDRDVRAVLASLREPKLNCIHHPDVIKQVAKNMNALEQTATIRSLTRDEVLALTVYRRQYSAHMEGLSLLASKSLEEQQSFNASKQLHWQSAEMVEMRRKFIEVGSASTQSVATATQSAAAQTQQANVMDINNIINR